MILAIRKLIKKRTISEGALLVGAMMLANFLNFLFNAFLGRELSAEDFGVVTIVNTIVVLAGIFIASVGSTVNRHTAYISAKKGPLAGVEFLKGVKKYGLYVAIFFSFLWFVFLDEIADFFNIDNILLLAYFTPFLVLGVLLSSNKGFIQGNLKFSYVAILVALEALSKFIFSVVFVYFGFDRWVALSILFAIFFNFIFAFFLARKIKRNILKNSKSIRKTKFRFPRRYYVAAVLTGLSTSVFLSIDVVLAKHYFDPVTAGEYSLLSLVGKIIYFLGSLLMAFIITLVSRDEGAGRDPNPTFYKIFAGVAAMSIFAFICLGPLGGFFVPFLFGDKALPILDYLVDYSFGIMLFTLASAIVVFHLARKQYLFSFVALFMSGIFSVGIMFSHGSIQAIVDILFVISIINILVMVLLHFLQRNGRFVFANLVDLANLFYPLPKLELKDPSGKKILIFNWRDTKHVFAGGAESYVHELAKRWVRGGNTVTLFCGNDGKSKRNELVDGVNVFRRGGFYTVYAWAFIYYIFKFRGRYDIIIDSQNGIPFFTPIYAKEKVFSLLHHVHQDIFYKFLSKPLAFVAATLENRAMPFVYKNTRFITVSESTKKEMEDLGITRSSIDIVHPGVDLSVLEVGEKSKYPIILSLGRLKAYKSIDILVKAYKKVLERIPDARLIIAGDGEEKTKLKKLVNKLKIEDKVDFLGKVTDEEKVNLYKKAWVFVNPSMMEGWGITTVEANACGTPVVASDVPGLRDSVKNLHTGFLAEYGNNYDLSEKIIKILENKDLRELMMEKSEKWAQNFDWEKISKDCLILINEK